MMRPSLSSRRRGFTLVELMISLTMGLVVAMAAVGLARSATATFHEQARASVTEMAVRMASQRLRQDLMRISYMSTGNIQRDPQVARRPGATPAQLAKYTPLAALRGVRIEPGYSSILGGATTANGLAPDRIEITGNLTTDDQYSGTIYTGGCGQIVRLDPMADAAVWSLAAGDPDDAAGRFSKSAEAAFKPTATEEYLAQVTDAMGCTHYAPVCSVTLTTGSTGSSKYLLVGLDATTSNVDGGTPQRGVLYANSGDSGTGLVANCGSSEMGKVTIAPVSRVRWELAANTAVAIAADATLEGTKYNIVRQRLDWTGAPAGAPEIVAEYGVDLKFGITYYDPSASIPANTYRLAVADLASDGTVITTVTQAGLLLDNTPGPEHVRSITYRVAARASMHDRQQNLTIPGATAAGYLARYCVDGSTPCTKYARVRTLVSEVALTNQARMTW